VHRLHASAVALVAASLLLVLAPSVHADFAGPPQTFTVGLDGPWEVAPAPDGRVFVTERDLGTIRVVLPDGTLRSAPAYDHSDQMLGLALHPDFAANRLAYAFQRYGPTDDKRTRIIRLRDDGTNFVFDGKVLIDGIDSGDNHDGGRMAFGPDRKLYVTTGDQHRHRETPPVPQDRTNILGKLLRLEAPGNDADGTAPADNPFVGEGGSARFVWSYGHRHSQGIVWDRQGRLWSSEHGPSGGDDGCCRDELNLIVKGGNYGWPLVAGDQRREGTIPPVVHSGNSTTWAPGGLAFGDDGNLYVPTMIGRHLRLMQPSGETIVRQQELVRDEYGRIRTAVGVSGALLFSEDKAGARIMRVPLTPPPPAEEPAPVPPAPAVVQQPVAPAPRLTTAEAITRLLGRARTTLARRGLRSLVRRPVGVRAGGLPPGRLVLRASLLRPGRRAVTVGLGSARVRNRAPVTVRLRTTRSGRRVLRRVRRARIVLTATHVATGGARVGRSGRLTVRR
jgi:glucose/arabinose dehydrogenase